MRDSALDAKVRVAWVRPSGPVGTLVQFLIFASVLVAIPGCPPPPPRPNPLEAWPMSRAIGEVNANAAMLVSGLKAQGSARGQIVSPEGDKRSFDFTGKLLLIPPRHLRFDLQNGLGQTEVLFGSNEDFFWLFVMRDDDTLRLGRYATPESDRAIKPALRADWLIEALGLNPLPFQTTGANGPVQLIEDESQRLLFLAYDAAGQGIVRKEYFLSRRPPRLVERIIYRDESGGVKMRSQLDDYRDIAPDGPKLPHRIRIDWPSQEAWLEYTVNKWEEREELTLDHPAFQLGPQPALQEKHRHVIDIDSGRELGKTASSP